MSNADTRCTEDVHDPGPWPRYHQCKRKAITVDDRGNPRCGIHSPAAAAARRQKATERYERQTARTLAPYKRAEAVERQRDALADLLRRFTACPWCRQSFQGSEMADEARTLLATIDGTTETEG